jgi:LDH2 family malate/lactate/ureidoglycolate dehydrogenase
LPEFNDVHLRSFAETVFKAVGVSRRDAQIITDSLIQANLEGIDSHGISRLPVYVRRMMEGRISVRPCLRIIQHGSVLNVDGDNGLGQVVSYRSLEAAIPVAKKLGMAGVFIRRSNHNGTGSFYCQQAMRENMVLIAMTNTPPGIVPTGGREPRLGTNPVAFGFPVNDGPPLIVDLATSMVARGKVILAAREKKQIPKGWAVDENGMDTTDPSAALKGAMLPVGGAKGYALACAIEMFCGVLSGAAFGKNVVSIYEEEAGFAGVGHHFILYHVPHFMSLKEYGKRMDAFLRMLKETPPSPNSDGVYYPGERRYQRYLQRKKRGIPLSDEVVKDLNDIAESLSVQGLSQGE